MAEAFGFVVRHPCARNIFFVLSFVYFLSKKRVVYASSRYLFPYFPIGTRETRQNFLSPCKIKNRINLNYQLWIQDFLLRKLIDNKLTTDFSIMIRLKCTFGNDIRIDFPCTFLDIPYRSTEFSYVLFMDIRFSRVCDACTNASATSDV